MEQEWFEMKDVRGRFFSDAVWIPLRGMDEIEKKGQWGHIGYKLEFFGVKTIAFPTNQKTAFEKLTWSDMHLDSQSGYFEGKKYIPSDVYRGCDKLSGLHLVLNQSGDSLEIPIWHLHQDFVITLGLK